MKNRMWLAAALSAALMASWSGPAQAAFAYSIPAGLAGNSDETGSIGMDFTVGATPISITSLGAFDSSGDGAGFGNPVFVAVYNRNTQAIVGPTVEFNGVVGNVVGSYRYLNVAAFTLPAGFQGSIVAWSYDSTVRSYDAGDDPTAPTTLGWTTDDTGLITFEGTGRLGGAGSFPDTPNARGAPNRYGAGTFEFQAAQMSAVPVPPSLAMLGTVALGGLVPLLRRVKAKVTA